MKQWVKTEIKKLNFLGFNENEYKHTQMMWHVPGCCDYVLLPSVNKEIDLAITRKNRVRQEIQAEIQGERYRV